MIAWESRKESETEEFKQIDNEIRAVGEALAEKHKNRVPKLFPDTKWNKGFKSWEYPKIFKWLERLRWQREQPAITSDSIVSVPPLRVMDFGCGFSPFLSFLASKGYNVWGVDNDSDTHIEMVGAKNIINAYPDVHYYFGEIHDLEIPFDAIISASVIEHIRESERPNVYRKMKELLGDNGKSCHIVDYYPDTRPERKHNRVDFVELAETFGYSYDEAFCPGSPQCKTIMTTEEIANLGVSIMYPSYGSFRIFLGDDI